MYRFQLFKAAVEICQILFPTWIVDQKLSVFVALALHIHFDVYIDLDLV